jgi:hypothetical protein
MNKMMMFAGVLAFSLLIGCKAGDGGKATLKVYPKHHSVPIVSTANYRDTVYVFFNEEELPTNPTTNADMVVVGEVGEDQIHVENLKAGNYYIYATGWDPQINMRVFGGLPLKIKYSERKDEIKLDLPVVE